jgi:hypothetical protein
VFWVSEPNLQLRLEDEPLGSYATGLGPRALYQLFYRNRGACANDHILREIGA